MNASPLLPIIDVEQRFSDASRTGTPDWLWFEVPQARWAEAVATIETAIREVHLLGHSNGKLIDDPVALSIASYTSGMGPLLGSWTERGKLATTAANAAVLRTHLDHNRARMARLAIWASEAVDALSAGGAAPIVMKGMHTAFHYFDEPGQRAASDIDLLLRHDELPLATRILANLGYVPRRGAFLQRSWSKPDVAEQPVTLTYVHRDDPWSIDLHEGVTRKLAGGSRMADIDSLVPTVALDPWRLSPGGQVFPPPLLLIHLLMHASCSFEGLTLQRQYEIGLVIHKNGGREGFDWPSFAALCDRAGLWPFLYPAMRCAERLLPDLIPDPIMRRAREACPPMVRKLLETHSSASVHRVGRWSWTERYMWADGMRAYLRQFLDELGTPEHMSLREIASLWKKRVHILLGTIVAKGKGEPRIRGSRTG